MEITSVAPFGMASDGEVTELMRDSTNFSLVSVLDPYCLIIRIFFKMFAGFPVTRSKDGRVACSALPISTWPRIDLHEAPTAAHPTLKMKPIVSLAGRSIYEENLQPWRFLNCSGLSLLPAAVGLVICCRLWVNCNANSVKFGEFPSNPGITGVGTDISFVLTAGLSLTVCSSVQIFCDRLRHHKLRRFFEPLVISFSDQQIVRGISLSIATLYTSAACTLDAYRYDMICYLLLMTIVSHLSAELVRRSHTSGYKILAILRFGLIGCQVVLAGLVFSTRLTPNFPTGIPAADQVKNTTLVLPAVCFDLLDAKSYSGLEDVTKNTKDISGFSSYIIMAIFYCISIIFTLAHILTHYLKPGSSKEIRDMEDRAARWTWFWWLGVIRGSILLTAWIIWTWTVVKLYLFRGWMSGSGWLGEQAALQEEGWTFGQLMSVLLMMAAPLAVMNAWSTYGDKVTEDKVAQRRLGFHPYQPVYQGNQIEMQNLIR